jgi:hypothetical protein
MHGCLFQVVVLDEIIYGPIDNAPRRIVAKLAISISREIVTHERNRTKVGPSRSIQLGRSLDGGGGSRTRATRRAGASVDPKHEQGCAVWDDYTRGCPIRNDNSPASAEPETSSATPTILRNLVQVDLEAVAGDVRIRSARVPRDCRDDAKHRLTRCNRDQA